MAFFVRLPRCLFPQEPYLVFPGISFSKCLQDKLWLNCRCKPYQTPPTIQNGYVPYPRILCTANVTTSDVPQHTLGQLFVRNGQEDDAGAYDRRALPALARRLVLPYLFHTWPCQCRSRLGGRVTQLLPGIMLTLHLQAYDKLIIMLTTSRHLQAQSPLYTLEDRLPRRPTHHQRTIHYWAGGKMGQRISFEVTTFRLSNWSVDFAHIKMKAFREKFCAYNGHLY